jgi:dUTPase
MKNTEPLKFKKLDPRATLPTRGSSAAAGLDLYSIEVVKLQSLERKLVRTGLAIAIPKAFTAGSRRDPD